MADSIQAYQKALSKGAGRPTKALLTVWGKRIVRKTCVPSAGDRNESKDDGVNEGDLDEASQFLIGKILVNLHLITKLMLPTEKSQFLIGKILDKGNCLYIVLDESQFLIGKILAAIDCSRTYTFLSQFLIGKILVEPLALF